MTPIDKLDEAAAFLSDILIYAPLTYPMSKSGGCMIPDNFEGLERKWKEAERLVALFSLVRTQEKTFPLDVCI